MFNTIHMLVGSAFRNNLVGRSLSAAMAQGVDIGIGTNAHEEPAALMPLLWPALRVLVSRVLPPTTSIAEPATTPGLAVVVCSNISARPNWPNFGHNTQVIQWTINCPTMDKSERQTFITLIEKMVTPAKVARLFQGAEMLRKLPTALQKKLMQRGARTDPYIAFVVEPYSLFLAYEVTDEARLTGLLPRNYELVDSAMFHDTRPRKCVIIGAFNVHTSVFWGNRVELYIIARNKTTGLVSWIIQDYETNTISYDPGRGFIAPGTKHAVLTTSFLGELILDVEGKDSVNVIRAHANVKQGRYQRLNRTLWIEGNLSVDYGSDLGDAQTKPFGLTFDPGEMDEALALADVEVLKNTFFEGIIASTPFEACCFPFAQHFYTTTIPLEHKLKNEADLEREIRAINRRNGPGARAQ